MVRRRKKVSHARELYYVVFILLVVALGLFSIWGPGGYADMKKTQLKLQMRSAKIERLERDNQERMRSIDALRHDKDANERYARQKGYVKPGEIIQQIPEENPAAK